MGIVRVFNDVDGCWGANKLTKPRGDDRQDLRGHFDSFTLFEGVVEEYRKKGITSSVCTGRELSIVEGLMQRVGVRGESIVEMGQVLFNPTTGLVRDTAPLIRPELTDLLLSFRDWIGGDAKKVYEELAREFDDQEIVMMGNTRMWTLEFRTDPTEHKVADMLFAYARDQGLIPEKFLDALDAGDLVYSPCDMAFDFRPNIGKREAVAFVQEELELQPEQCLGIGDSYHSDMPMMEQCGSVGCVANANNSLKEYVRERGGHVASQPFMDGVIEIYRHFLG